MKINWGYRVALLYIGFAGLILYLVTRSMKEDVDLVSADYYAQELKYQDKKESEERNNNLNTPADIFSDNSGIRVEFPKEFDAASISGSINVFRPSDKAHDFSVDVACSNNHVQLIDRSLLEKGMYRIKLNYTYQGENYYYEKQIVVRD
jgi:hypothetical protein